MTKSVFRLSSVLVLWCCAVAGVGRGAITIVLPASSTTSSTHICGPSCRCATTLLPLQHSSPVPGGVLELLLKNDYHDWVVDVSGELAGTLYVSTYDAHTCDPYVLPAGWTTGDPVPPRLSDVDCMHGAELEMWYDPAEGELPTTGSESFHWIQLFESWGGYCGYSDLGYSIDCTSGKGPYYYFPAEEAQIVAKGHPATWYLDAPQAGCATWGDSCPGDNCPGPCHWGASIFTFLAIGTPGAEGTGTLTVYDGIYWGFTADCAPIPVPGAIVLVGVGSVLVGWLRRRQTL